MAIKAETNGLIITITDENGSVVGLSYKGHLYHIYSGVASTWDEAKAYCEARGGHLATISDEAENTVLYDFKVKAGYQKTYIGLSDANEEGNWQWVTGEPLTYTNWYSDQPDNGRGGPVENYAELWNGTGNTSNYAYTWNDATFHLEDSPPFICEWESLEDAQNNIKWTFKTVGSTVSATGKLGGKTVVTITGLKKGIKASDLTDTTNVIAVSKNALSSSSTVRLKGNYRLALADGVTKSETTTTAGWYIDGTNATYKTIGRTAGYYVDFGGLMIKYVKAATSKNLTTVKGLKEA